MKYINILDLIDNIIFEEFFGGDRSHSLNVYSNVLRSQIPDTSERESIELVIKLLKSTGCLLVRRDVKRKLIIVIYWM